MLGFGHDDENVLETFADKQLEEIFENMKKHKDNLENLDTILRRQTDIESSKMRKFLADLIYTITPKRLYDLAPHALMKFVAEEGCILELHETLLRGNVVDGLDDMGNLSAWATTKFGDAAKFEADIDTAESEHWNAQKLLGYFVEQANAGLSNTEKIRVKPEIYKLFEKDFAGLSDAEKEKQRVELVKSLRSTAKMSKQAAEFMLETVASLMPMIRKYIQAYFIYKNIYGPAQAFMDAAKGCVSSNNSMFTAKYVIKETIEKSLEAFEYAAEAIKHADQYSIDAPDMVRVLETCKQRLRQKHKILEYHSNDLNEKIAALPDRELIEAEIVNP